MNNLFTTIAGKVRGAFAWMRSHKIWTGVIIVVILGGGYLVYAHALKGSAGTQYVLAAASRGTLTVTVTGSGQVEANQSLDLSPKASGEVTYVGVKAGDQVSAGTVIARVDDTDAEESLSDAEASLTSAQISYAQSTQSYQTDTTKDLDTAFTTSTSVSSDIPSVLKDLDTALHAISTVPGHTSQQNKDAFASIIGGSAGSDASAKAESSYQAAVEAYDTLSQTASQVSRSSTNDDIEHLIDTAYDAANAVQMATNDTYNLIAPVNDKLQDGDTTVPASFTSILTSVTSDESKMSTDASSALSARDTLTSALSTLDNSSVPFDVQTAQLNLTKAEEAVSDAQTALEDYVVTAPFSGLIASVGVQVHDQAGSGTTVATLITNEEYAQLSLNEVDAEKVKVGDKADLTFDAVDGLTIPGTVTELDSVGTVSQGVVTYDVKISFDEQDSRVKPGMTVDASITTDSAENAIIVPSAAVITVGNQSYVQVVTMGASATGAPGIASTTGARGNRFASSTGAFASSTGRLGGGSSSPQFASTTGATGTAGLPAQAGFSGGAISQTQTVDASSVTVMRVPVMVGLSNDTETEIVSGISEGALVVERTISGTSGTTSTNTTGTGATGARTTTTGFGAAGARPAGGGGGGAVFLRGG